MDRKVWKWLVVLILFSFFLSGCNFFGARKEMANAKKLISDLKGAGGEKLVPYEYTSAEKFLEVSRMEFRQFDYKQAKEFAERSKSAGEAGLAEVKKK